MLTHPPTGHFYMIISLLMLATFVHVFWDSVKDPRMGSPWTHALMTIDKGNGSKKVETYSPEAPLTGEKYLRPEKENRQ